MTMRGSPSNPTTAGARPASAQAEVSTGQLRGAGPRRRIPYLVLGVLLVIACAAAAVITSMQLDRRVAVLVLARPVVVGHVLTPQDFRQVAVVDDAGLGAVPVAAAGSVLGRPVAFSLPAGTLLTRGSVGAPQVPVGGRAVVAVGLRAGQFPPPLSPGARVAIELAATNVTTSGTGSDDSAATGGGSGAPAAPVAQWTATVVEVGASSQDSQNTVVSLQLSEADARQLGAVPAGQVGLVELSPGGS